MVTVVPSAALSPQAAQVARVALTIWLALMGGVTALAAVVGYLQFSGASIPYSPAAQGPSAQLAQVALVATPIIAVMAPGLALFARRLLRQGEGDTAGRWLRSVLISGALLEGGGLMAIVLAFIGHTPVPLAAVAFLLGVMALLTPTPGRFAQWADSVSQ